MQLIRLFDQIWSAAKLPLRLRPYHVLVTSPTSGLIETVPDSTSIDSLKKNTQGFTSLAQFFVDFFGETSPAPCVLCWPSLILLPLNREQAPRVLLATRRLNADTSRAWLRTRW